MTNIREKLRALRKSLGASSSDEEIRRLRAEVKAAEQAAKDRKQGVSTAHNLATLNRQVATLQGLIHQQADFTTEELTRAGWQSEEETAQQHHLQRALQAAHGKGDVIAGPWTGEVGFELLYWIPFLNWLVAEGLDRRRLVIVSRGGAAPWYSHLTSRYVDLLDLMTPDELRQRTTDSGQKRKQVSVKGAFDREIVAIVKSQLNVPDAEMIHPSAMFRLFGALWRRRSTIDLVDSFTSFRLLGTSAEASLSAVASAKAEGPPAGLPDNYVVVKFYFSAAFPDTAANRAFVADLLRRASRQAPIALMSTSVRIDDHVDFQTTGTSGVYIIDPHTQPQKNLELQTEIIRGSRGFIGTYGGFSYLAPFYGVRSVSFFSRRQAFQEHHLDLANSVFDKLLPGGFVALDSRAIDLVEPAVARWAAAPSRPAEAGHYVQTLP